MQRRWVFYGLFGLWLGLFAYSFYAPALVEAAGDGFLRGANRVTLFLSWHVSALAFAIAIGFIGERMESASQRWLSRSPVFLHIVAATAIIALSMQAYQAGKAEQAAPLAPPKQAVPSSQ